MAEQHSLLGEGTDVGLIGGVVVAVFFLILDTIEGVPLQTPSVLGEVLLFGNPNPSVTDPVFGAVLVYTVVHFVAFALLGILLTELVHLATTSSIARIALLQVFFAFEVFFYGVILVLANATQELFPFWTILTANALAAVAMGLFLWRRHPAFRRSIQEHPIDVPEG